MNSKLQLPIIIVSASIIVGIGLIAYAFLHTSKKVEGSTVTVSPMDISLEVDSTGKVKASQEISLAFDKGGRVTSLAGDAGTRVYAGEAIASLASEDLSAQILQAQAALEREQIKLSELTNGAGTNNGGTSSNGLSNIQTGIVNNRQNVADKITDSYTKLDSALGTYVDKFFSSPRSYPQFGITSTASNGTSYSLTAYSEQGVKVNTERRELNDMLSQWATLDNNLSTDQGVEKAANYAEQTLEKARAFLADVANIVNPSTASDAAGQTLYAGYRTDINNARTAVDAALTNLRTATQSFASAQSTVSPYELDLQKSAVKNAQAALAVVQAQVNKGIIYAPINGVITGTHIKVGEIAAPGAPAIDIISEGKYQIETHVSEADISQLKVGLPAKVVLDAYGPSHPFEAKIVAIDPAETTVGGVSGYKVTLEFNVDDPQIKSGMTAEVTFEVGNKSGVLAVPDRAIIRRGNDAFVLKESATSTASSEQKIETGMRGSNGYTEVVNGLQAGDTIVTFGK